MNVSDHIAEYFAERGWADCFTISGAGNIRLLDAIARYGFTRLIACHHEQACAQAAIGYYRATGKIAPVIVTCGGGAANVVTGIVSAWMDSIPLLVIAGQENTRNDRLRAYGVQGFDLSAMVKNVTKRATCISKDELFELSAAADECLRNRPGPCVVEIPMSVQGQHVG